MPIQRVNFFQRNSAGAPLVGGTITTTSRYDDNTAGPVIGNALQLSAANQPGFYYFDVDVDSSKRLTVVTDAGGTVTGNNRYNSFVLDDIDPTARLIAQQVWDDQTAARNTAGSFGLALGTTLQTTLGALPAGTADAVWDEATAGHAVVGSFGELVPLIPLFTWQIAATTFGGPMGYNMGEYAVYVGGLVEQTPDLVWDANVVAHGGAGTFGLEVGTTTPAAIAAVAGEVWDEGVAGHGASNTFGERVNVQTPADIAAVAGDVWDVTLASHVSAGSTGEALDAIAGTTPAAVASAVWAALVASNQAVGSFGEAVTILQALNHRNWRLTGATYSGTPARLTAATLVLYPTKADALAQTNALLTQAFTATYNGAGEMTASLQTDL